MDRMSTQIHGHVRLNNFFKNKKQFYNIPCLLNSKLPLALVMSTLVMKTWTVWRGVGRKNHERNNFTSAPGDWKEELTETQNNKEEKMFIELPNLKPEIPEPPLQMMRPVLKVIPQRHVSARQGVILACWETQRDLMWKLMYFTEPERTLW